MGGNDYLTGSTKFYWVAQTLKICYHAQNLARTYILERSSAAYLPGYIKVKLKAATGENILPGCQSKS
jgi:hypothetical protein